MALRLFRSLMLMTILALALFAASLSACADTSLLRALPPRYHRSVEAIFKNEYLESDGVSPRHLPRSAAWRGQPWPRWVLHHQQLQALWSQSLDSTVRRLQDVPSAAISCTLPSKNQIHNTKGNVKWTWGDSDVTSIGIVHTKWFRINIILISLYLHSR